MVLKRGQIGKSVGFCTLELRFLLSEIVPGTIRYGPALVFFFIRIAVPNQRHAPFINPNHPGEVERFWFSHNGWADRIAVFIRCLPTCCLIFLVKARPLAAVPRLRLIGCLAKRLDENRERLKLAFTILKSCLAPFASYSRVECQTPN